MQNEHPNILEIIADNVKKIRHQQQISQEELSFRSGLNKNYISAIECARRNLSMQSLVKLAQGLEVKVIDLLEE
ncbi:helix-turn-helix domain-containing protein [Williamsoniiplasma lucivorax]|uniref:Transcriptional regulator n=1 Tax=Williamsoniiplasma lucivorax TaxID=209274 RepID=A0A2S5RER2_9MOLU|nr:helix-turn-helix transcriptional regulator [Williamsoniiplasma lucivorax]PPE05816.1 transcriptional regulator [Williamsoniiplasma lucivorax]